MQKLLQIAQGLALAGCIYASAAGLMAGQAFGDTGPGEGGVSDRPQCPNAYFPGGGFAGCESPGAACTDYTGTANTCTVPTGKFNCNCGPF